MAEMENSGYLRRIFTDCNEVLEYRNWSGYMVKDDEAAKQRIFKSLRL